MKKLTAVAAFLILLLPTRLPRWLDTAAPLGSEPLRQEWRTVVRGTIAPGGTIGSALEGLLAPATVNQLVLAARPVYDLARITAGRPFGVALGPDGLLRAFTYGVDALRTLRVAHRDGRLVAELHAARLRDAYGRGRGRDRDEPLRRGGRRGRGRPACHRPGRDLPWDVDFNTEIQPGDSFRVVVEKQYLDGNMARYGRILAAEFTRGERLLRALRHEGTSGVGYYGPEGRPLRKAFLRSPLRFTRISSRFTRSRLHPILGVRRPHLGVDYAAPTGTPVQAAADGTVIAAGREGGYGKTVRLRHANGYETLYGHLSRIDVRRGQRVAQGTRIGAVGATGLATGPHLDYRMARQGQFVDPLRIAARRRPSRSRGRSAPLSTARRSACSRCSTSAAPERQASR